MLEWNQVRGDETDPSAAARGVERDGARFGGGWVAARACRITAGSAQRWSGKSVRRKIAAVFAIAAALTLASCNDYREWYLHRVARRALVGVAGELTRGGPIEPAALRARFSPIGEGLFVYPADVVERGRPPVVWLIKGGKPYALNETARALTPRLPDAREIPTELLTAEESSSQLEMMVWLSLTRGAFVGEPPEYELAGP